MSVRSPEGDVVLDDGACLHVDRAREIQPRLQFVLSQAHDNCAIVRIVSCVAVAKERGRHAGERTHLIAMSTPDVISRYFAAQATRDFDTLVTLFADDAVVVDEAQTRRGTNEIRAWRENVASVYEYTTELRGLEPAGDGTYVARVHLEGNFPGGTVDLRYRFTLDGDAIRRLEIG